MVAELAAERKLTKYSNLPINLIFQPIIIIIIIYSSQENWEHLAHRLQTLSRPLVIKSAEGLCLARKKTSFLFQRLSVALQRFNAIILHNTMSKDDPDHREFTDASNVTDNTGMSKHRLSPYRTTAYYFK